METDLTQNTPDNAQHECQNCDWVGPTADLKPIQDIEERIAPGEEVPSGECPMCGALCHVIKTASQESVKDMPKLLIIVRYAGDPPSVQIVPKVEADIHFVGEDPDFYFVHNQVRIFNSDWKGCISENMYAIESGHDSDGDPAFVFDVRDIVPEESAWDQAYLNYPDKHQRYIAYAIDKGWITQEEIEIPCR